MKKFQQGHALLVGVGADLKCTVDDAKILASILGDESRCAYQAENIHLLTENKASKIDILLSLDTLSETTSQDDTVIIYFSGHGCKNNNSYFLIPNGYDPHRFSETTITGEEFSKKIADIPAARKIVILDCCHAGGVGQAKNFLLEKSPIPREALNLFKEGSGYVMIASSKEDEVSFAGEPCSVFTTSLIESLCGQGIARNDGYVRVSDLIGHTRERVPYLTGGKQHPVIHFEKADNFVVSYYSGGEKGLRPLPFNVDIDISNEKSLDDNIAEIEKLYTQAKFSKAFKLYVYLCGSYPEYQSQANMILSRFSDYENDEIMSTLSSSELRKNKLEIGLSFLKSIAHFKNENLGKGSS